MADANEHLDKIMQELRRGTITIGALSQLSEPQYGYSLVTMLHEKGIHVEPGTLYPLLRRLEKQGLLDSTWDTNESRPRKYYVLSKTGKEVFDLLVVEWKNIAASMDQVIENKRGDENGDD
ncbi:PadR family transcriptional regulator [Oceanobacillus oncorhynchi subsp. incaldanensis]|uniref:Lineage-specific thermal regulator protein n=2 Tax=Oceanobacillus TaxID=182709 RepID=A0A0A1MQ84_9BACI|nr:PadR family transcriptional regulator [Oceanobacillus oncorhynchi]MDM8102710.1 PadR family transcriptional regulator [Oceanobacillus oncorhynchi]UUI40343.1 PadR family transcriptional regulator [Oceanobacillus oncorhynchi]GIO20631.1 PadR family transcriptional regulator [Oceanobacillus oncorhynchi subsp. incaldanensis]CEI81772.1 lineage-specific thermal regulator protein [Oceanobacillus oncorhynchi]